MPFEYGDWKGGRLRDYIAELNNAHVEGKAYLGDDGKPIYTPFPPLVVELSDHKIIPEEAETVIAIGLCSVECPAWLLTILRKKASI